MNDDAKRQVDSKLIEGNGGIFAINVDKNSPNYGSLMFKHGAGNWVKQRTATAAEIEKAEKTYETLKAS